MTKLPIDKYSLRARIVPAIVTIALPFFVFSHFYINPELSKFYEGFSKFSLVGDIALSSIVMFYFSQYARIIGKSLFENLYFNEEAKMPTTEFLLYSNSQYSTAYKKSIGKKIKNDFGITLDNEAGEQQNLDQAKRKIIEAVSHIRKRLTGNDFLFQHNIEYGAMRNTIGGAALGIIISIINLSFFHYAYPNQTAVNISLVVLGAYALVILTSKWVINAYGKAYAKILVREYMAH